MTQLEKLLSCTLQILRIGQPQAEELHVAEVDRQHSRSQPFTLSLERMANASSVGLSAANRSRLYNDLTISYGHGASCIRSAKLLVPR